MLHVCPYDHTLYAPHALHLRLWDACVPSIILDVVYHSTLICSNLNTIALNDFAWPFFKWTHDRLLFVHEGHQPIIRFDAFIVMMEP